MTKLTFFGAAQEVTGSCHCLELDDGRQILLDCGMHQGSDQVSRLHREKFPFRPKAIDAVILSHAHIDHSGLLPLLVERGFRGPIYCTDSTRELLPIMLRDTVHLYLKDLEWENRRRARAGKKLLAPEFGLEAVEQLLEQTVPLRYHQEMELDGGVTLRFHDAGHILGSAIVQVRLPSGGRERTLVFSGDLGNPQTVLMNDPEMIDRADWVLLEGTYGNRDHKGMGATLDELAAVLQQAYDEGGNVLIPAFALGRTQEVLYHLGKLYHQGRLPQQKVFLDSPMAIAITKLYSRFLAQLDDADIRALQRRNAHTLEAFLPPLSLSETVDQSMAINQVTGGAIIIAGSGMCNGGRIRHHFKHNLWRSNCHLVIVGFQARGTLGRRIVDGAKRVRFFGQEFAVKAQVHTLGGFSAHAGQQLLLDWARHIDGEPRFQLVHGEPEALAALQEALWQRHGIRADIPGPGSSVYL